jgi:hypothetical protein
MPKKRRMGTISVKTAHIRKASRRIALKCNPRGKKGPPLTDYLLEEHIELGFPLDRALDGKLKT